MNDPRPFAQPLTRDSEQRGPVGLTRGIGLAGGISLNVINMVGVGPFITLPLIVIAMRGPRAIFAWIFAALLTMCDGLVWAELGAAMPRAGGSYQYLNTIYGARGAGRFISFLYVWQLSFSAPLSIASGCVGLAQYAGYLFPSLRRVFFHYDLAISLLGGGRFHWEIAMGGGTLAAMACCALAALLLYGDVKRTARLSTWLGIGVLAALGAVIVAGATHFHSHLAFDFKSGSSGLPSLFAGLGPAMLIAVYDYWGAYSICFVGGEVRDPGRTIPRAVLWSIALVAAMYLLMNEGILGVVPWREMGGPEIGAMANARFSIAAVVVERVYGRWAGEAMAALIIWTAFASVYALLFSYSRVPYAAALDGNYFRIFARLHPRKRFPNLSLLALALLSMVFCMLRLIDLLAALVVIRILLQFLLQHIGVMVLRRTHPEMKRPFKIWLYPLPPLAAIAGFLYILLARPEFGRDILLAAILAVVGTGIYGVRARSRGEWPFQAKIG